MHRFYCPNTDFSSQQAVITDKDELHHLRNVLRLKKNDNVCLFDGKGGEASGTLAAITSKQVNVQIRSARHYGRKKPLLILACALPKKSKFELIIEKATELGVDEIIPLRTRRTEIHLQGVRRDKKTLRFQTVAVNAAKQSNRTIIPVIHPITSFTSVLEHLAGTTAAVIPSLIGKRENLLSAFQKIKSPEAISFLIGPEGDFTPEEYAQAYKSGCIPVTLGEAVLKVETAAICALSCASLFFRR